MSFAVAPEPPREAAPRREISAVTDGVKVYIYRRGEQIGKGYWNGARIEGCDAVLADDPDELAAIFEELEAERTAEEARILEEVSANAQNEEGVDLTLIDWALSMTPRKRLKMNERYTSTSFSAMVDVLIEHGVEFIIVGGVAACMHAAPYVTHDLDIVYSRKPENIERLLAALRAMEAIHRESAGRRIVPNATYLRNSNIKLLQTKEHGPLDVLGSLSTYEDGTNYEDILPDTVEMNLGDQKVRVLSLPRLIAVKEAERRPKDLALLPVLKALLARQSG